MPHLRSTSNRARAIDGSRMGSNPSRVTQKTWETALSACAALCSVMDGRKGKLHVR